MTAVLTYYKGSFVAALEHLYPDIGLTKDKFLFYNSSNHHLKDFETQKRRLFLVQYARKQGFDPSIPENWHRVLDELKNQPVFIYLFIYH